jgi:hypothetical protein
MLLKPFPSHIQTKFGSERRKIRKTNHHSSGKPHRGKTPSHTPRNQPSDLPRISSIRASPTVHCRRLCWHRKFWSKIGHFKWPKPKLSVIRRRFIFVRIWPDYKEQFRTRQAILYTYFMNFRAPSKLDFAKPFLKTKT